MVEVGSMRIVGGLDTRNLDAGFRRVQQGFSTVKSDVRQATGLFSNLGESAASVAGSFAKIGAVAVSSLAGLAAFSPAVAPALAQMQIGLTQISMTLGERFRPVFEKVAQELIPSIGQAIEKLGPQIDTFIGIASTGVSDLGNAISGQFGEIDKLEEKIGFMLAGFGIGGLPGAVAGYVFQGLLPKPAAEEYGQYDVRAESAAIYRALTSKETYEGLPLAGKALKGGALGAALGVQFLIDLFQTLTTSDAQKAIIANTPNKVTKVK